MQTPPDFSLDGAWSLAYGFEPPAAPFTAIAEIERAGLPVHAATVPGNVELDLHAAGVVPDPFHGTNLVGLRRFETAHFWYFRKFAADAPADLEPVLRFEGVDCYADVYLNGVHIGACDNMLIEHEFDVGGSLRAENELVVHIRPALEEAARFSYGPGVAAGPANYAGLYVRKAPHMFGWDIMPRALSAGLWRPVTLRFRPPERLESVYLRTLAADEREARLVLHYGARLSDPVNRRYEIEVVGTCGDSRFAARAPMAFGAGRLPVSVPRPKRWWPRGRGAADLYDVTVRLFRDGDEIDSATFRHGIRTVVLRRTSLTDSQGNGEFCFEVNGERVFVLGTNWVPADAYHSRDVERIPRMIEFAKEAGCNMIRCWGGNVYENDLFFDLCDEAGILVWQDFALACAVYPQDDAFCERLAREATRVVRRLRGHACLALWAGDNECDEAHDWHGCGDPNAHRPTREVLPRVLRVEDPARPYLPSSPYIDTAAYPASRAFLPERHLWGPRDHYKSDYYRNSLCHFASEIGYHGCPAPASVRRFVSPDKQWPPGNDEWLLHATSAIPGVSGHDSRIALMENQVREMFGEVPDNLSDFAFASQCVQAEAFKFFIELFRAAKWRRTGILWWNLIDGWPQFSDAVVDYYFEKKLAFETIRRSQQPLCLMLREPANWRQELVAANDTRQDVEVEFSVRDGDSGEVVTSGQGRVRADAATPLATIPFSAGKQRFYVIDWSSPVGSGRNHYLAGNPPWDWRRYRDWIEAAGLFTGLSPRFA